MSFHKLSSKYYEAVGRLTTIRGDWQLCEELHNILNTIDSLLNIHMSQHDHHYHIQGCGGLAKLCRILDQMEQRLTKGMTEEECDTYVVETWRHILLSVVAKPRGRPIGMFYDLGMLEQAALRDGFRKEFAAWCVKLLRSHGAVAEQIAQPQTGTVTI